MSETETKGPTPGPWHHGVGNPKLVWSGTKTEAGTVFHQTGLTPEQLKQENARLREALAFYAHPPLNDPDRPVPDFYDELNFGDRAASALAPQSGGTRG